MLTEVQTSVPIMWQTGPQLGFYLAAFSISLSALDPFLHVLEGNSFLFFSGALSTFSLFLYCIYKKKNMAKRVTT